MRGKEIRKFSQLFQDDFYFRVLFSPLHFSYIYIVCVNFSSDGKTTGERKLDKKLQFYESKHYEFCILKFIFRRYVCLRIFHLALVLNAKSVDHWMLVCSNGS